MSRFLALLLPSIIAVAPTTLFADCADPSGKAPPSVISINDAAGKVFLYEGGVVIRKGVPREKDASSPVLLPEVMLRRLSHDPHKGGKCSGPYEILIYQAPSNVDYQIATYTPAPGVKYEMRYYRPPGTKRACVPDGEIIPRLPEGSARVRPLNNPPPFLCMP